MKKYRKPISKVIDLQCEQLLVDGSMTEGLEQTNNSVGYTQPGYGGGYAKEDHQLFDDEEEGL